MYAAKYVSTAKGNGKKFNDRQKWASPGRKEAIRSGTPVPAPFLFFIFGFSNSLCDSFYIYIFIFFYIWGAGHFSEHAQRQIYNKVGDL